MKLTVREFISEVRTSLRAVDLDAWLPAKFIHSKGKGIASLFIKREADDKRLYMYTDLWVNVPCVEMEEEDLINCCDINIPSCKKVMISKKTLPEMFSTRYGYLVNVSSLDYEKDYTPTTPRLYKATQLREYKDKRLRYFWISNGRIVIPRDSISQMGPYKVTLRIMATSKAEALKLNSCDASGDECYSVLDEAFVAPEHLLQDIKNATVLDIIGTYKRFSQDELVNSNSQEQTNSTSL